MTEDKQTYCLQTGLYFSTEDKKQNELIKHLIDCKPLSLNENKDAYMCKCGLYKFKLSTIISLIQKAASNNQIFIRLD